MRRRLLKSWPALSHWFGIRPWHVERLTVDEMNEYLRALDEIGREQRRR